MWPISSTKIAAIVVVFLCNFVTLSNIAVKVALPTKQATQWSTPAYERYLHCPYLAWELRPIMCWMFILYCAGPLSSKCHTSPMLLCCLPGLRLRPGLALTNWPDLSMWYWPNSTLAFAGRNSIPCKAYWEQAVGCYCHARVDTRVCPCGQGVIIDASCHCRRAAPDTAKLQRIASASKGCITGRPMCSMYEWYDHFLRLLKWEVYTCCLQKASCT